MKSKAPSRKLFLEAVINLWFAHETAVEKDDRNFTKIFSHFEHSKFHKKSETVGKYITWLIDFASKLCDVQKILDFILGDVLLEIVLLY